MGKHRWGPLTLKFPTKGLRKNNLAFFHLIFTPSSAAPQSRNLQRRPGYAYAFAQSFAAKSGANLSANSTKLFLRRPLVPLPGALAPVEKETSVEYGGDFAADRLSLWNLG